MLIIDLHMYVYTCKKEDSEKMKQNEWWKKKDHKKWNEKKMNDHKNREKCNWLKQNTVVIC